MPNTLAVTDSSARPVVDEITERFDPITCLDDRFRLRGKSDDRLSRAAISSSKDAIERF
jgi:hypothetical protein